MIWLDARAWFIGYSDVASPTADDHGTDMTSFSLASASPRPSSDDRASAVRIGANVIVAVADGVGGITGGATAAERFVAGVMESTSAPDFDLLNAESWLGLLVALDHEISRLPEGGETTGIALVVTPSAIVGAACGDSQAWVINDVDAYALTDDVPRKPRLGSGRARPSSFSSHVRGRLVVATDGLFDYVPMDAIRRVVVENRDDTANALIRLIERRYRALPDDVAMVVIR